jgi:hypothetical protein
MGRKKEKTTSKKEDDDEEVLCSTTRKSERLIAANAAVAAAAPKTAAAAAAPAAVSPTATATDALPPVILEGRFEGYMSPSYVAAHKREYYKFCWDNAREDFTFWQDKAFDELREHSMRRQKMLDEVRSTRTGAAAAAAAADDTAAAAAAAAAEDTLVAAAAADAAAAAAAADTATKAAAATIARPLPPHSSMRWCGGSLFSCEETPWVNRRRVIRTSLRVTFTLNPRRFSMGLSRLPSPVLYCTHACDWSWWWFTSEF